MFIGEREHANALLLSVPNDRWDRVLERLSIFDEVTIEHMMVQPAILID